MHFILHVQTAFSGTDAVFSGTIKRIAGGICPAVETVCGTDKLFFVLKLVRKKRRKERVIRWVK